MSEVDRLSNSGLYPALPIADQRSRQDKPPGQGPGDGAARGPQPPTPKKPAPQGASDAPRPPKSRIDEYV